MNEQKILINSKNLKMNYMEETKLKIIELEKAMELEQEKTESEVVKYTRIITNLEGEKQNLEKLLEEEFEKHNILLVRYFFSLSEISNI